MEAVPVEWNPAGGMGSTAGRGERRGGGLPLLAGASGGVTEVAGGISLGRSRRCSNP